MLHNKRYIANCPHCGKWNKMNLFTEGYRDIYERF
jgi:Zn ribbon nucleic-acid-binding protein